MAEDQDDKVREVRPIQMFDGPVVTRDFRATPERIDHRHPAAAADPSFDNVPAPEAATRPAPDAEPMPTPATPTPHPDGPRPLDTAPQTVNSAALSPDTVVVMDPPQTTTTGHVVGLPDDI